MHTGVEQLFCLNVRQALTVHDVLAVHDHTVGRKPLTQGGELAKDLAQTNMANDVADEKDR
jgi:hypothetical protein